MIAGAFAASHGPLLSTAPEQWYLRARFDHQNPTHYYRGESLGFDELLERRRPGFGNEMTDAEKVRRYDACQRAIAEVARRFAQTRADLAIVIGNDQAEVFSESLTPAFTVFAGETFDNVPFSAEIRATLAPGLLEAHEGHCPPGGATYRGAPAIARSIVASLIDDDFDVAVSDQLPTSGSRQGIPHAFGFIFRRIMADAPPPTIPIFVNAGEGLNRPRPARCLAFGHALRRALDRLPADVRVVIVSSGGLSHFTIDEELDRRIIRAMHDGDEASLAAIPEPYFLGNTCETKNWYPTIAMMNDHQRRLTMIDYVPCYRTEAGTGQAMAFATWE